MYDGWLLIASLGGLDEWLNQNHVKKSHPIAAS
jgi:hypothetical protein